MIDHLYIAVIETLLDKKKPVETRANDLEEAIGKFKDHPDFVKFVQEPVLKKIHE